MFFSVWSRKTSQINSFTIRIHQQKPYWFFMFSDNDERSVKETLPKLLFFFNRGFKKTSNMSILTKKNQQQKSGWDFHFLFDNKQKEKTLLSTLLFSVLGPKHLQNSQFYNKNSEILVECLFLQTKKRQLRKSCRNLIFSVWNWHTSKMSSFTIRIQQQKSGWNLIFPTNKKGN